MISFRCLLAIVLLPLIVRGDGFFLEDQDSNYRCECAVRRDGRFFVWENRVDNMECTVLTKMGLARLSTFASKAPAVAGLLLVGLHYTVVSAASAASPEILGGGWAGNVSPSWSSRIARSGFGST